MIHAIIYFHGDPSCGIPSYSYGADIPDFPEEERETVRNLLIDLYKELDGEFSPTIYFQDEVDDEY